MKIIMASTIDEIKAIEKQFNHPENPGIENSYQCLCAIEDIARELLQLVENHKPMYRKLLVEKFRKNLKAGKK